MTRSPEKVEPLRQLGALPIACDVFDRSALREAVVDFAPDALVNELTDLPAPSPMAFAMGGQRTFPVAPS